MSQKPEPAKPSVSVIMPTFNRAGLIAESLRSLFEQTYPISEILVVDDGSTDNTSEVVAEFADRVRYVKRENGGKNAAINTGLTKVSGDLVWIMDDDDLAPALRPAGRPDAGGPGGLPDGAGRAACRPAPRPPTGRRRGCP